LARSLRVEYPGAVYHVIQKGNNGEHVFERPEDKYYLMEQFRKAVKVDGIELFAYAIMSNHYHLALRVSEEPLYKVMHRINTSYGTYYNKVNKRSGHVFGGRYKAILVQEDKYLISLVKYIHRNPVNAGICARVEDYHWSSDYYYRKMKPGFIQFGLLLDMLSPDKSKSVAQYKILMSQDDDPDYVAVVNAGYTQPAESQEEKKPFNGAVKKPLDQILKEVTDNKDEFEFIKKGSRLRKFTKTKAAYAKSAWEQGYSMEEIGRHINVSAAAVFKYLNR